MTGEMKQDLHPLKKYLVICLFIKTSNRLWPIIDSAHSTKEFVPFQQVDHNVYFVDEFIE